jgi:hypothetical protein
MPLEDYYDLVDLQGALALEERYGAIAAALVKDRDTEPA